MNVSLSSFARGSKSSSSTLTNKTSHHTSSSSSSPMPTQVTSTTVKLTSPSLHNDKKRARTPTSTHHHQDLWSTHHTQAWFKSLQEKVKRKEAHLSVLKQQCKLLEKTCHRVTIQKTESSQVKPVLRRYKRRLSSFRGLGSNATREVMGESVSSSAHISESQPKEHAILRLRIVTAEIQHMQQELCLLKRQMQTYREHMHVLSSINPSTEPSAAKMRPKRVKLNSSVHRPIATNKVQKHDRTTEILIRLGLYNHDHTAPPQLSEHTQSDEDDEYCEYCCCYKYIDRETEMYICHQCGRTTPYLENDKRNLPYNERMQFTKNVAYERINHWRKWLKQLQGEETRIVPQHIVTYLRKAIHSNQSQITYNTIRYYLKKRGYAQYYQNIWQIIQILTGNMLLYFSTRQISILVSRFYKIQEPFERHRGDRINILYSAYLLRCFCKQEGWYEYLRYIPQLKTAGCRSKHDDVYGAMCKDLQQEDPDMNWKFPK